jgi:hypothetical protein
MTSWALCLRKHPTMPPSRHSVPPPRPEFDFCNRISVRKPAIGEERNRNKRA